MVEWYCRLRAVSVCAVYLLTRVCVSARFSLPRIAANRDLKIMTSMSNKFLLVTWLIFNIFLQTYRDLRVLVMHVFGFWSS